MRLPSRTLSFLLSDSGDSCLCASAGLCTCRRGAVRPSCRQIIEPLILRTDLTHRLSARSSNDEWNPICWPHAARTPKSLSTCQHLVVDAEVRYSGKALRRVEGVAYCVHHRRWPLRTAGIGRWLQRRFWRFHNADGRAKELACTVKRCMSVYSSILHSCISAVPRLAAQAGHVTECCDICDISRQIRTGLPAACPPAGSHRLAVLLMDPPLYRARHRRTWCRSGRCQETSLTGSGPRRAPSNVRGGHNGLRCCGSFVAYTALHFDT